MMRPTLRLGDRAFNSFDDSDICISRLRVSDKCLLMKCNIKHPQVDKIMDKLLQDSDFQSRFDLGGPL